MHLYCMRHGEAYQAQGDSKQALTLQGQLDVANVANFLIKQSIHIDHIIHSGKLRAKQTAEIIMQKLATPALSECPNLLAEDAVITDLVTMIQAWHEDTLLIGHLPMMGNLVQQLTVGQISEHTIINYQPGTLVRLKSCHKYHWVLDWVLHPDLCAE